MSFSTVDALKNNFVVIGKTQNRKVENDSDVSETASIVEISDDEVPKPALAHPDRMISNNMITMTNDYKLKVNGKVVDQWDEETIRVAEELNLSLHNLCESNEGENKGYLNVGYIINWANGRRRLIINCWILKDLQVQLMIWTKFVTWMITPIMSNYQI